ncbi:MAG TPA: YchF/TatD family DNA exonuclease [bacterium]|nr:YchF/TatD family DNA exonuclease [Myxococcales bacterium]OQA60719.1 MAG: putative deoxyribonuclease YcfH [bacterium ADurb.Bin270]HPW45457.1 YchF/TatD family DNA exonuclease [bacterium]HQC50582.1 YchF/TatD family DNA exonuclease [bacterium]HQG12861.1 YchF/TatD family DNA exonuclease [bacterium]
MQKSPKFIDSHAHLSSEKYEHDIEDVLSRSWEAGLEFIINIGSGYGLDGNVRALDLARKDPRIFATVGIHPHDAGSVIPSHYDELRALASDPKVVAIGETGLDYFHKHSSPEVQREVFRRSLEMARLVDKPVVIHDRDAHDDVIAVIKDVGISERGGVFHCFSGDLRFAEEVLSMGFLISIPGIVTFDNASTLQEVASVVPLEKMLIETDCPFLAPAHHRGKRNEPAFVTLVAEKIAKLKSLSVADVARVTSLNARRLFSLPGSEVERSIAYVIRNSLYLNITNGCNLACKFCPKFIDFEVKGHYLKLDHEPDVDEVFRSIGQPEAYNEVVFCGYGEPTRRIELVKVIAERMKQCGVKRVRLNTDGLANLFYGRNVLPELTGLIDSISISLNAPNAEFYAKVCPSKYGEAAYGAVCDFIVEAKKFIPEVVASVVTVPGQDVQACEARAKELGVPLRVREYMNVG